MNMRDRLLSLANTAASQLPKDELERIAIQIERLLAPEGPVVAGPHPQSRSEK